jgi:hypothetical protein
MHGQIDQRQSVATRFAADELTGHLDANLAADRVRPKVRRRPSEYLC